MALISIVVRCERRDCDSQVEFPYPETNEGHGLARVEIGIRAIRDFDWHYDGLDDNGNAKLRCPKAVHGI